MTDRRIEVWTRQILDLSEEIEGYVAGMSLEEFMVDTLKQRGTTMCLVIIGELVGRIQAISPEFLAARPSVAWKDVRGLRNRLAHNYFETDWAVVWDTAVNSVPTLVKVLGPTS